MTFSDEKLARIWNKTEGTCAYCGKRLAWINYGVPGRGSWEVDHSLPKSKGGTDHLNNLVPACTSCNREKGDRTARQFKIETETESDNPIGGFLSGLFVFGVLYFLSKFAKSNRETNN